MLKQFVNQTKQESVMNSTLPLGITSMLTSLNTIYYKAPDKWDWILSIISMTFWLLDLMKYADYVVLVILESQLMISLMNYMEVKLKLGTILTKEILNLESEIVIQKSNLLLRTGGRTRDC